MMMLTIFFMLLAICIFGEILCPLPILNFFLLLSFSSLYFLDKICYSVYDLQIFSPVDCLFTFLIVYLDAKNFKNFKF
jgi:hypothetical protein